jgi:hypothetical protein
MVLARGTSKEVKSRGRIEIFTPRYSFPGRKRRFLWNTTQKTEMSQKKQLRFVARPKSPLWPFSLLKVTPPLP